MFRFAGEKRATIHTHVRSMTVDAMQEVLANAVGTGAPLHIVHVNSMALGEIDTVLDLIGGARRLGLDVTTEAYPYTAGSTSLHSSIFDEGWQDRLSIGYGDLQWEATGERLTKETFERYRRERGTVILHFMQEEWIEMALANDWVIVASDGMPYAPKAHPRTAGTYSRVLGRYVRERGTLDLMTAILKMSYLPGAARGVDVRSDEEQGEDPGRRRRGHRRLRPGHGDRHRHLRRRALLLRGNPPHDGQRGVRGARRRDGGGGCAGAGDCWAFRG